MEILHTQKEVLRLLLKNKIADFKAPSFVEAVKRGQIPYRKEKNSKRKMYQYEEVRDAIIKAGIGGLLGTKGTAMNNNLDALPAPKEGQTQLEYAEVVVKELGEAPTITDANIYKTLYQGKLEKIKYEQQKSILINRDEIENKAFSVARSIRDKILSVPDRLANELATIDDAHVVKELLFAEFNKMLEGFSKDSFI